MANNMKRSAIFLIALILFISSPSFAQNAIISNNKINLYFFWAEGCPHCRAEKAFLDTIEEKYSNLEIHRLEVTKNKENAELLMEVGKRLNVDIQGVPFTVIGDKYVIGYYDDRTTGAYIENLIIKASETGCVDIVGTIENETCAEDKSSIPDKIKVPIFGEIEIKNMSLPILSIVIGALDGFNPCAMWVLIFLISLLLGLKDKKRMWIFGFTFLFASAFVYFLFMAAWLNFFIFVGYVFWIRIIIGLVAFYAAYYNIKEYITNPHGVCKVTSGEKMKNTFEKLKKIIEQESFIFSIVGLIGMAFAVNIVEGICSAGLPAVYTQVLALSNLPSIHYYLYMLLYIFVFMLDDLVIFILAMITLQESEFTGKYSRISHGLGGIVMFIIGMLLIFRPEWLMFG